MLFSVDECNVENKARKDHDDNLKTKNFTDMLHLINQVNKNSLKSIFKNINIIYGKLEDIDADGYVNAANEVMEGGGGVDEMIHKIGGNKLLKEILAIPKNPDGARLYEGEALVTNAPNFKASKIIHTVAPYLDMYGNTKPKILATCYKSILHCADINNLNSIAIPSIGTGFYGFPMLDAIDIAINELKKSTKNIILVFNSKVNYNIAIAYCVKYLQ